MQAEGVTQGVWMAVQRCGGCASYWSACNPFTTIPASQRKALQRLKYEGLTQHPSIKDPDGEYFRNAVGFAEDRYAYYRCFTCKVGDCGVARWRHRSDLTLTTYTRLPLRHRNRTLVDNGGVKKLAARPRNSTKHTWYESQWTGTVFASVLVRACEVTFEAVRTCPQVCGSCSAVAAGAGHSTCPKHGSEFIEFKVRNPRIGRTWCQ